MKFTKCFTLQPLRNLNLNCNIKFIVHYYEYSKQLFLLRYCDEQEMFRQKRSIAINNVKRFDLIQKEISILPDTKT